jgi:hypothetical protein
MSREYLYQIPARQMVAALLSEDLAGWDRAYAVHGRTQKELYPIIMLELAVKLSNVFCYNWVDS